MERLVIHSPPPWVAAWGDREGAESSNPGTPVLDARGKVVVFVCKMERDDEGAIASLIAAAPEMMALLRDCRDLFVRENKPLLAEPIAALLKRIDERRGSDPMIE